MPRDEQLITVEVLKGGVYNGSDHRALPFSDTGERIKIPAGPYAESLIADRFVGRALTDAITDTLDELAELDKAIDAAPAAQGTAVKLIPDDTVIARSRGKTRGT